MRVRTPGIGAPQDRGSLRFEGRAVPVAASDTIASAMVADGERGNRIDETGARRGVWCGMGVCHECTVRIDGDGGSLACMTPARVGAVIEPQPARRSTPTTRADERPETELTPDVLVIGAGPAGLAAAADLAVAGLDVLIVDNRGKLGGQYYKQPDAAFELDPVRLDPQYRAGRRLIDAAHAAGARTMLGTTVWAAFDADRLLARSETERWVLRPRRVVIATGAYERGVPIPGWTLPGVMTTGAGQALLRSHQVAPGSRVLIAGNGPLNLQLAAELARAGAEVAGVVEAARMVSPRGAVGALRMALTSPGLTFDGVRYLATLARRRVPVITGAVVERVDAGPDGNVRQATVASVDGGGRPRGRRRRFDVDAVCLGYGFLPSNDLARSLGCAHEFDPARGSLVTVTDETGRTSRPTVWSIGDAAAVRGAKFAQAQGAIAARAIVADLRGTPAPVGAADARRHLAFQGGANALFAAAQLTEQLADPETVVCRCEGVTYGELSDAMADHASTPGAIKRVTRAGMGKCQGRYCGPVLMAMAQRRLGVQTAERAGFAPQAPVLPVPIGDVAAPQQPVPTGGCCGARPAASEACGREGREVPAGVSSEREIGEHSAHQGRSGEAHVGVEADDDAGVDGH